MDGRSVGGHGEGNGSSESSDGWDSSYERSMDDTYLALTLHPHLALPEFRKFRNLAHKVSRIEVR